MYINSKFKDLEVNETHFQVPKMGGYTRHIQDYYFEHDFFYTYKRWANQIWPCYFAFTAVTGKIQGGAWTTLYYVWVWAFMAGKHSELHNQSLNYPFIPLEENV